MQSSIQAINSQFPPLDFFARQVVEGFITGKHKSPFHGFSAEFSDYRQYNPGESTRNIDWHLYGRTDRLYVKQFEEETNLRCQILIDQSTSMYFPLEGQGDIMRPNKLTFAAYAAAVLINILHRQRDAFGLTLFSSAIDQQTPCRSNALHQRHLMHMLDDMLQPVSPQQRPLRSTSIADTLHLTAEQLHRRSLVVLFTDAFTPSSTSTGNSQEPLFDAMRHLRHNKHEVIIFHTYHRSHELELDYDSRPYRFVDLESDREIRLQPQQIAQAYRQQMQQLQADLQLHARQYNIDYVPVDVSQPVAYDGDPRHPRSTGIIQQILLPFLIRRSKM